MSILSAAMKKNEIINQSSSNKNFKIESKKVLGQRDQFQSLEGDQ
jgi:hypothetical protein